MSAITYVCGNWIQNYGQFSPGRPWGRVIHTLECEAKPGIARSLSEPGGYLASQSLGPHRMTDPTQVVDALRTNLKGGHVGSPGNSQLVGYEVSGRAAWTTAEWLDGGNRQQALENDATIIAEDYVRDGWTRDEIRYLSGAQIQANAAGGSVRGLLTHNDVSEFLGGTNHWDPGPGFPFAWFLSRIQFHFDSLTSPPVPTDWFDMATSDELRTIVREEIAAALDGDDTRTVDEKIKNPKTGNSTSLGGRILNIGARLTGIESALKIKRGAK